MYRRERLSCSLLVERVYGDNAMMQVTVNQHLINGSGIGTKVVLLLAM